MLIKFYVIKLNYIVKYFPMTNYDILRNNNEKLSNLLSPKIIYNDESNDEILNLKIEYKEIDLDSMVSYDNKLFCM